MPIPDHSGFALIRDADARNIIWTKSALLHGFFDVPLETATACAAIMFLVTYLAVIPGGVILSRVRGMSLRGAAHSAEQTPAA